MQREASRGRRPFPGDEQRIHSAHMPLPTSTSTATATPVPTVTRHKDQELRLLSYCLKSALLPADNTADADDIPNGKTSECFLQLSECLMGGVLARQKIASGIQAYKLQDYKTAYRDWQIASRLCDNRELFYTLNYLISLSFDFGQFQKMLNFSVQQFQVGKYLNDTNLIAESYLNLASSRGLLGNWELCLSYCKNCLLYLDVSKVGYVYMSICCAYLELSQVAPAVGFLKLTFDICAKEKNYGLVVQSLVACSSLFYILKSYNEAKEFALRAVEVAEAVFGGGASSARFRRTKVHLIPVKIKLRQLDESLQLCEEAVRGALDFGDRFVQAKCMLYFADIRRLKGDFEVAYQSYQAASESGYHYVQVRAMLGQAKCIKKWNRDGNSKVSHLKALDIYQKVLEIAVSMGCKLEVLHSHRRIASTYSVLGEPSSKLGFHMQEIQRLCDELKLLCVICGELYGTKPDSLKILNCGHIFHARCMTNEREDKPVGRKYCVICRNQTEDLCDTLLL
ncbi:43 kDa receptor-associated protein of the synapse-like [Paramacrobiotus metropolitanus]|uniref:43 kDa receptor-associated protein of the synapse-like n=1 Tax=Paramacrobiotus metropolitanus TaxID=2943436 RepID=UPI00244603CE|nr:43 kDa receptor-associated protein of the synapse-like [Paramacrobiotus metropolitanus]